MLTQFFKLLNTVAILSGGGTCLKCISGTTPLIASCRCTKILQRRGFAEEDPGTFKRGPGLVTEVPRGRSVHMWEMKSDAPQKFFGGQMNSLSYTKLGLLITIKIRATRCHILMIKCTKIDSGRVSTRDPAGGAQSASPSPLAGLRGPTYKGRDWRGQGREGRGEMQRWRGGEVRGKVCFIGFRGWTPWARRRILGKPGIGNQCKPTFVMFPCKQDLIRRCQS